MDDLVLDIRNQSPDTDTAGSCTVPWIWCVLPFPTQNGSMHLVAKVALHSTWLPHRFFLKGGGGEWVAWLQCILIQGAKLACHCMEQQFAQTKISQTQRENSFPHQRIWILWQHLTLLGREAELRTIVLCPFHWGAGGSVPTGYSCWSDKLLKGPHCTASSCGEGLEMVQALWPWRWSHRVPELMKQAMLKKWYAIHNCKTSFKNMNEHDFIEKQASVSKIL